MDLVLQGLTWKTCLVYLGDIIVIGKTFKGHLENLKEVLTRIHGAQLKRSRKKCSLFWKEVQYLGHLVSAAGVSMYPTKVDTVRSGQFREVNKKFEVSWDYTHNTDVL